MKPWNGGSCGAALAGVPAPCPRAELLTAAFWMICFEPNTAILENLCAANEPPEAGCSRATVLPGKAEPPPINARDPARGCSSAPSPPILSHQATGVPPGLLRAAGKRCKLWGQMLLLLDSKEVHLEREPGWELADDAGGDDAAGPRGELPGCRGESLLGKNGYMRAISNAYK